MNGMTENEARRCTDKVADDIKGQKCRPECHIQAFLTLSRAGPDTLIGFSEGHIRRGAPRVNQTIHLTPEGV